MDPPTEPERPVAYTVGIKASAARVEHVPAASLVRRLLAEYGRAQIFEWYQASLIGKVAFDVDGKADTTTAAALLTQALEGVRTFFHPDPPPRTLISSSHGGEKLSYRIYCVGVRMLIGDVKRRILRLKLDGRNGGPFDPAIYSANQKLRTTGSIKTSQDTRVLKLIDDHHRDVEPTRELLLDTLVQVVDPAWPLLDEPPPGPTAATTPAATTLAVRPREDDQVSVAPAPKRARGRPKKEESIPADALAVLLRMGYVNPRFVSVRDEGFVFTADNRASCPNCILDHQRQNWWCIPKPDGWMVGNYSARCVPKHFPKQMTVAAVATPPPVEAITPAHANFDDSLALLLLDAEQEAKLREANLHYHDKMIKVACYRRECLSCDSHHDCHTYTAMQLLPRHCWSLRNDDNSCPGKIFHHSAQLANILKRLIVAPNDEALIGLFLEGHRGGIHVDRETDTTYFWDSTQGGGGRWRQVSNGEFDSHLSGWLNALLYGVAALPEFKDARKQLEKALAKAQTGNIRNLRHLALGRLSLQAAQEGATRMDANPYLLGAGTSVIDLKARDPATGAFTTVLRPARPEDLVTKSVGYDIPPDFADCDAVEAVFAQIYPVEEERRFFQLFGGYCLLGKAPAKGFLCLTDRRKGDNGKSTAVRLLRTALGDDYVIDNKQNLLYEARFASGVNAHDSGMMAFEGKRLALMEELSAGRALDTSFLKQITGGESSISVRAANSATTRAMAWSAKIITVFNEGCAPRFKVEDNAFTKRMIVLPHRAFFCKDNAAREAHMGEEHTFDADGAKIEALEARPWAILAWFLQGLERYWASGYLEFQVPAVCQQWADDLVQEQDEVAVWRCERVEERNGACLTIKAAFDSFQSTGSRLGKTRFSARLKKLLGDRAFMPFKKIEGKNAACFEGFALAED